MTRLTIGNVHGTRIFALMAGLVIAGFFFCCETFASDLGVDFGAVRLDKYTIRATLRLDSSLIRVDHKENGRSSILLPGGFIAGKPGGLEVSNITRWIELSDSDEISFDSRLTKEIKEAITFRDLDLAFKQVDTLEGQADVPIPSNQGSGELAADIQLGQIVKLDGRRLLPVTFSPIAYRSVSRVADIYTTIEVNIPLARPSCGRSYSSASHNDDLVTRPRALNCAMPAPIEHHAETLLLLTSGGMTGAVDAYKALHPEVEMIVYTFESRPSSEQVREIVKKYYHARRITTAVILGSPKTIPMGAAPFVDAPSDYFYSLVDGQDSVADIVIGRIPTDDNQIALEYLGKARIYKQLSRSGTRSRKVLAVAGAEGYPEKYSRNISNIVGMPNPRQLEFKTLFGGKDAKTDDVIKSVTDNPFSLILYRGHGLVNEWEQWDVEGQSLTTNDVELFRNFGPKMSVVFNIACSTGDVEKSGSLTEKMLFLTGNAMDSLGQNYSANGAIAVLASTRPSYTRINDMYAMKLMEQIQKGESISIGRLVYLANNQMVRDSGSDQVAVVNVMMYGVFGDPLITPWFN